MSDRLHVHVPCNLLAEHLDFLLERHLQPEIALKADDLEKPSDILEACCRRLDDAGLGITMHGPFMDLNPGALEPLVKEATLRRFRQTLVLAKSCNARLTVFHPGFDRWHYGGRSEPWLEASLDFWPVIIEQAADQNCHLALENIFDVSPQPLADLLRELNSPWVGHCFDIGHWNLFAEVSLEEWFSALGDRLVHLHLHDNDGTSDAHLPIGEGNINFSSLFELLGPMQKSLFATLEVHSKPGLLRSLPLFAPLFRS